MAIAVRQVAQATPGTTSPIAKAFGSNVLSGSTIVAIVKIANSGGTFTNVRDNLDGAVNYTVGVSITGTAPGNIWITYFANCAAGAMTVTLTFGSGSETEMDIYEVTGMPTTAVTDGSNTASGSNVTITSGTITTTNAHDILFAGGMASGNISSSGGEAGWTFQTNATTGDGSEYIIVSSTQTNIAGTFTQSPSGTFTGAILALQGGGVSAPTVTAQAATNIATTSATLNGTITATGGANATVEGFNWGLTAGYGQVASTIGSFGTGAFANVITGLSPGQTYHYQAFATNSGGTGVSGDNTFTALTTPPLTWDSSFSLWDQNVVSWQAGQPLTWDSPLNNWDDPIMAYDSGNVEWDSQGNWDDLSLVWDTGAPIEWDSRSTFWDSPLNVWDVGTITWDNLLSKWDDPLIAWDAAFVADWDSAVTFWDSNVTNWDTGPIIVLGNVTMLGIFGIRNSPIVVGKIAGTTLQGAFGIRNSPVVVGKIASLTMQGLFGIRNSPQVVGKIAGLTMQALLGIRNSPQIVGKIAGTTMQSLLGITSATIGKLLISSAQMQGQFGIRNSPVLVAGQQIPPQMLPYSFWGGGHY